MNINDYILESIISDIQNLVINLEEKTKDLSMFVDKLDQNIKEDRKIIVSLRV